MHRCDTTILVLLISVLAISRDAAAAIIPADDIQQSRDPLHKHSTPDATKYPDDNNSNNPPRVERRTSAAGASEQSVNMESTGGQKVVNQVESSLLHMFGLKSRPRPKDSILVPQYMIDLYKEEAGITGDVQLNLGYKSTSSGSARRYSGNTIRSFYHEGEERGPHQPHHKVRLYFNVSSIPSEETLEGAELRVYRLQVNDSYFLPDGSKSPSPSINKSHRIDIQEVIRPATKHQKAITRLIDTRVVYPHKTRWESFDIALALRKWRRSSPSQNHGLEVHYTDMAGGKPAEEHVRLRRSAEFSDSDWYVQQPFLVAYTDDGKDKVQRQRRSADKESKRKKKSRNKAKQRRKKKNHCKRHPLYVDFQTVGWTDWIIAPPGYDAYFCHGECPFYMPDHLNATNHAIVQNMVNSFNPQAAPKPCCVPTELSDIAMLYLDEEGKVVLKTYQEMVVEACGCR